MEIAENLHLTYCSNIHPGETWEEVFAALKKNIPGIKNSVSPDKKFGIGLRLSAEAAGVLLTENHLDEFKSWLKGKDCYVFTMNGFPFGNFHHSIVKDEVYKPDWTTDLRLQYTLDLINVMAELISENSEGGISTSPLSFKPWIKDTAQLDFIIKSSCFHLMKCVEEMAAIRNSTGKIIHLDIEPEPRCLLENSDETIFFFKNYLIPFGVNYFNDKNGLNNEEATKLILDHIRICYDVCHFAVEFEEPGSVIAKFQNAGIKIGKVQISSALKVLTEEKADRKNILEKYSSFAESTYLHQTIAKNNKGELRHFTDLPDALKEFENKDWVEWRTHYHVPVFMPAYSALASTQEDILEVFEILKKNKFTSHLEVETYTWDVLPKEEKLPIDESIIRELKWLLEKMK
ncbi:MAG: metabolite traffic protein EboE [Bacteroidetes bacterium]|nr:metabolite traffic protein EboE [Bacteroidota bacterium]